MLIHDGLDELSIGNDRPNLLSMTNDLGVVNQSSNILIGKRRNLRNLKFGKRLLNIGPVLLNDDPIKSHTKDIFRQFL